MQLWVPQKAHLAGEVQSGLPGGAGIWGEGALVVLIPAFTAVLWRWQKILCEVKDEIAEGQEQKTPCETHSEGYRFQALAANSQWALTVPGWEKSLHSNRTTEWVILLMLGGTD